jgi:hypothetical protein
LQSLYDDASNVSCEFVEASGTVGQTNPFPRSVAVLVFRTTRRMYVPRLRGNFKARFILVMIRATSASFVRATVDNSLKNESNDQLFWKS